MENEKLFENRERPSVTIGVMTSDELQEHIYKGEPLPRDTRFLDVKEGGVFKYFFISDITDYRRRDERVYPFVKEGEIIVGLAELEKSPYQEKVLWIKFISVDPAYESRGHGSELVKKIFEHASQEGCGLETSLYSKEGYERLRPVLLRSAKEFSVNLIDSGDPKL